MGDEMDQGIRNVPKGNSRDNHTSPRGEFKRILPKGTEDSKNHSAIDSTIHHLNDLHIYNVPVFDPNVPDEAHAATLTSISPRDLHKDTGVLPGQTSTRTGGREKMQSVGAYRSSIYTNQSIDTAGVLGDVPPDVSELYNWRDAYITSTTTYIPETPKLHQALKVPLGIIVRPYLRLHDNNNPPPLVEDGLIIRCQRCRSYLNPFVKIHEDVNAWRCNICKFANELPAVTGSTIKTSLTNILDNRIETKNNVFDYLVHDIDPFRPEFTPIHVFLIDVSYNSTKTGLLSNTVKALSESLELIPNKEGNVKISIMCVDDKLHFFKLSKLRSKGSDTGKCVFTMFDVADIDEPWLPLTPQEILIPLKENEKTFQSLLQAIPSMFESNFVREFALLSALNILHPVFGGIGGKLTVFSASEPSNKRCEQAPCRSGHPITTSDRKLILFKGPSHRELALKYNELQISMDFILVLDNYVDVEMLSCLSGLTGGQIYTFQNLHSSEEQAIRSKFSIEIAKKLSADLSFQSSMRIRMTPGLKISKTYGNFFEGANGVYSFPVLPRDQEYTFELSVDKNLPVDRVYVQVSCLMTLCNGKKIIRVLNLGLESSNFARDIFSSVDQKLLSVVLARRSVQLATSTSLSEAQQALRSGLTDILKSYRNEVIKKRKTWDEHATRLCLPPNMVLLPLLVFSLLESDAFNRSLVSNEVRAMALNYLKSNLGKYIIKYICPAVHEAAKGESAIGPHEKHILSDGKLFSLDPSRVYIIDNSLEVYLWVGSCHAEGSSTEQFWEGYRARIHSGTSNIFIPNDSALDTSIRTVLDHIRDERNSDSVIYQMLHMIRDVDGFSAERQILTSSLNGTSPLAVIRRGVYKAFLQMLRKECA